jgi:hypothetical protein
MTTVGVSVRRASASALAIAAAIAVIVSTAGVPALAGDASSEAVGNLYEETGSSSSTSGDAAAARSAAAAKTAASAPSDASTDTTSPASDASSSPGSGSSPELEKPSPPSKTETILVPYNVPSPQYVKGSASQSAATTEVPPALPDGGAGNAATAEMGAASGQVVNYEQYQNAQQIDPQLRSLQEFIQEGDNTSSLGIEVQEAQRKTRSGKMADGLVIVGVIKGSPADLAGLRAYRHTTSDVIKVVAVGAALVFPPAVLVAVLADQVSIGDTYDLIIGVDGTRVTNFLDFEDRIREVQPGEIVYINILRNGTRMQVPVNVPANLAMPLY